MMYFLVYFTFHIFLAMAGRGAPPSYWRYSQFLPPLQASPEGPCGHWARGMCSHDHKWPLGCSGHGLGDHDGAFGEGAEGATITARSPMTKDVTIISSFTQASARKMAVPQPFWSISHSQ